MTSNNVSTVQVARSVEDVAALRSVCQDIQSNPEGDLDIFLSLLASRKQILRPHLIALRKNGSAPHALLVGRIEKQRIDIGLGSGRLSLPAVRCLTIIGGGRCGDNSADTASELVESVM